MLDELELPARLTDVNHVQPARAAIIRPAPPERSALERPIDAGLSSPITARRSFVIARAASLLIFAAVAPVTMSLDGAAVSAGLVVTAILQVAIIRYGRASLMVASQTLVDLHLALFILLFEPGFLPIAAIWIGASIAWIGIVATRRTTVILGATTAAEICLIGWWRPIDGVFVIAVSVSMLVVLFTMLGATLRQEMWTAESALLDALSAAGAVVHHANLEDGTVTRLEGDLHAITGWTADEWYSASHRDFIHPDDVDQYWIDVDAIEPDTVVDRVARVRHANGSWVWMRDFARIGIDAEGRRCIRGFSLDVTELEVATRRLADQARIDILTKLPNRWALTERLDRLLATPEPFALLMLDLDRFKEVNDTLGHEAGDQLLEVMASRLGQIVGDDDLLARLGGDEFAVVVTGARDEIELTDLLAQLAAAGSRPLTVRGVRIAISLSIGVALSTEADNDRASLMRHADIAMYEAKRHAMPYRVFDDSLERSSTLQLSLSASIPDAIRSGELMLHFQPKFDMTTGRIVGAEGLARWDHPSFGLLAPASFLDITLVSESSLDFALSTIRHVAQMIRQLSDRGRVIPIAANIALGALRTTDFAETTLTILDGFGVPHDHLVIELTETDIQGPSPAMIRALNVLAAAGVKISIDDFGTGHSSLERIRTIPVSELKVDRSFVNGMIDSRVDRQLVRSVIDLAGSLDFCLVAEGVETQQQADALVEMGCQVAQGYLFARPLPADEFVALVTADIATPAVETIRGRDVITARS